MILKIEQLRSIGKFRDYSARGNVAFKNMTLMYADNGSGKTTLTSVLRSLTKNDPALIRNRISTNATSPQSAQIIQRLNGGDTSYTFGTNGWARHLPGIEIFDTHFVNENIYSGFDFNDEQRKQLHQFIIGAAGVGIRQQIEQNKIGKAASRQQIESIEQAIIQTVGNGLSNETLSSFISTPANQNININQRITDAEAALRSANANSILQGLPRLTSLAPLYHITDNEDLIRVLEMNTATLLSAALNELFVNHCRDLNSNGITSPEQWLRSGFSYVENKITENSGEVNLRCPFCKQTIGNEMEIIQAYALKFDDEFNSLIRRLNNHSQNVSGYSLENSLHRLNEVHTANMDRVTAWSTHFVASATIPDYNLTINEEVLREMLETLKTRMSDKINNPSLSVDSGAASSFSNKIDEMNSQIREYNRQVFLYNNEINNFLIHIQTIPDAQNELSRLQRIRSRFDTTTISMISSLTAEKRILRNLNSAYSTLITQEQTAAANFFSRYQDQLNYYLNTVFRTPFLIDRVVHVPPQGRATQSRIDYKLRIDGVDISFDSTQPNCAKDCLSEGDKSTIALAFFLSKLDIDGATTDKIVVFDDPLSSFDRNRRLHTVQIIRDLLPNVKQLIVLSHNEMFLHQLSKLTSPAQKTCLRISENFISHSAFIEPLSLEALVENNYFKDITELENFLSNPDITKKEIVLGQLRNVLEAHIIFKFYRQISHIPAHERTFGRLITALNNPTLIVFRDNVTPSAIINKLNLINGVSCKPHHGEAVPDYAVLGLDPASITTSELASLIQDTLNLIDNQL